VGKCYLVDGLFKANVIVVDKKSVYLYPKLINEEKSYVYLLESPILWHARLGHVNYKSLQNLCNLRYIPKFNLEEFASVRYVLKPSSRKTHFTQLIEIQNL